MNTETPDTAPAEPTETVTETVTDGDTATGEETPDTFTADYVRELREESAAHRIKAKRIDDANTRLVAAYAAADGRLVDVDALVGSQDLVGDDGLVDRDRVAAAIGDLITAKPYLASRKPTTPLPQGVRDDVPQTLGIFDYIRERA